MTESKIQTKILKWLDAQPNIWTVKTVVTNKSGTPDILCCVEGRFVAFEVKAAKGKVSKLQEYRIAEIQSAGGKAYVVRNLEEVKKYLST